jgi:DNA-directed RNA polymerase specialized sigma24 family protein
MNLEDAARNRKVARFRVDRLQVDGETSLQGVCMGQELTVESIVRDHGKRLFSLAYRICAEEFLAHHLLQKSLLQIHRACRPFMVTAQRTLGLIRSP